jgi:hypothetical protein
MTREEILQVIAERLPRRYTQVLRGCVYIKNPVEFICFEEKKYGRAFYLKTLDIPIKELQNYIDEQFKNKMAYVDEAHIINYDVALVD